ncbi:glycoside hydrolase family 3 N-terminal domain-containing protein [uncultured Trichococcus sp.]|uniref:beta-glucosidase n=1 Tax=uncultured Trichococcus sp. TaxID=189665 RepID=UPI002A187B34|nr:glycoside hydrolase family 3 N-terminal domain-containing protein [uncultured Trichococcus sp.]
MSKLPYQNENLSVEERVEDLVSRMSVEEKVKQLSCTMYIPVMDIKKQDLGEGIGSFTLMGSTDIANDIQAAQEYVIANSPHGIPALVHGEALSGPVTIPAANLFPTSVNLGATFEPELAKKMSEGTRKQMYAYGMRHALSPVADLGRDLRWGRCGEGYGEDPTLTSAMVVAFVQGLQGEDIKEGVACTGKHFLGYSQSESAMNMHKSLATPRELREVFAKPFEAAINMADMKCVMNCYSEVNGEPMCANKGILTDMLRDELGFDGVVVSDYNSIRHVEQDFKLVDNMLDASKLCLEAGLDVELPTRMGYNDEFTEAVKKGDIDIALVERSLRRLLKLKFELGLFENPYPHPELIASAMDNTENNKYSHEAACKSVTLMKNDGILPIRDTKKKILVVGPTGDTIRLMIGHYTHVALMEMLMNVPMHGEVQPGVDFTDVMDENDENASAFSGIQEKLSVSNLEDKHIMDGLIRKLYPDIKSTLEALREVYDSVEFVEGCEYKGDDESHISEAVEAAMKADIVIMAVGGKNGLGGSATTGESVDSSSLDLMGKQEQLMREVFAVNQNMVILHTDGRPLCSEWAYENVSAIIEGWLPATYGGQAFAEVISGKYNPAGRTPFDVPRSAGHLPLYHYQNNGSSAAYDTGLISTGYIDSSSSALAPFGYGLSYTSFEYSDFVLKKNDNGLMEAVVVVKNVGDVDGEEVVQLYGKDLLASIIRPRQELIGFRRVALKVGESKKVTFTFNLDQMAFEDVNYKWILEKGNFKMFVGGHSDDVRAEAVYMQETTEDVNPRTRSFYAESCEEPA